MLEILLITIPLALTTTAGLYCFFDGATLATTPKKRHRA